MDPVQPLMLKELKDHVLERRDCGPVQTFRMRRPDTSVYSVCIIFAENRIFITGDIMLGEKGQGVISSFGYGLGWFTGQLGWDYLASKFLSNNHWDEHRAAEWCREMAEDYKKGSMTDDEEESKSKALEYDRLAGQLDDISLDVNEFYSALKEIDEGWDDSCPGYGYDAAEAGWLSAIQQRFAQLYSQQLGNQVLTEMKL
jgi:hypothetical protein